MADAHDHHWRQTRIAAGRCCACGGPVEPERRGKQQCHACTLRAQDLARARAHAWRTRRPPLYPDRPCESPPCETWFAPATSRQQYCSPECYRRARGRRMAGLAHTAPETMDADLAPTDIERIIAAAYARIQAARRRGEYPGIDPWERRTDPVSAQAHNTVDLWTQPARSPKAPRPAR
jgi:hypothetical protein